MVRDLWLRYLHIWRQSGQSIRPWLIESEQTYQLLSKNTKQNSEANNGERAKKQKRINNQVITNPGGNFVHFARKATVGSTASSGSITKKDKILIPPSRQLLLGFMYLACRLLKSYVIPGDFVRWSSEGILPICNLWGSSCIPESLKDKIKNSNTGDSRFLAEHYTTVSSLPTVNNVFYQSCALAKMLDISIPPVNAPLIARHMIESLQLPNDVWVVYTKLIKHF